MIVIGAVEVIDRATGKTPNPRKLRAKYLDALPVAEIAEGLGLSQKAVESLLRVILVEEDPLGVAGAADVDANCGVPVAGEPWVSHGVVDRSCIVLAVGEVLEHCGNGGVLCALWQPRLCGEPGSVCERNPDVGNHLDVVRQ